MIIILIIIFSINFKNLSAHEKILADSHGPISIMGDHVHKKNEYMFSYRLMKMEMKNLFQGNNKISKVNAMSSPNGASNSSGTYMNAPDSMSMEMHMFGAMYAPSDYITLMLMGSYHNKEMTIQRMPMAGGRKFDVNSSGFGDMRLTFLSKIQDTQKWKNHVGFGMSIPTGDINKRDVTPMSSDARLGYAMQNGTGTYDAFFLINNLNEIGKFKVGEQFFFKLPVSGKNDYGYKYGKDFGLNLWVSYRFFQYLSGSLKINYQYKGEMEGFDNEMNKRMSAAMDSKNQGFNKVNLGLGFNFVNNSDYFKNNRIALELLVPIYRDYKGIQMADSFSFVLGWQY